jgi:hypothetical protein
MIRDRSLVALLAGEFVSRLGSQFTSRVLPWFVLVTTAALGTFATFNFILAAAPLWEGTVAEETA